MKCLIFLFSRACNFAGGVFSDHQVAIFHQEITRAPLLSMLFTFIEIKPRKGM